MAIIDRIKQAFSKKEEMYTPQREAIDRRHDALQRQLSYYEKKSEIPVMEARIKAQEKEVYGNPFRTKDEHNIVKVPNHFHSQSHGQGQDEPRRVRQVNPRANNTQKVNRQAYTPRNYTVQDEASIYRDSVYSKQLGSQKEQSSIIREAKRNLRREDRISREVSRLPAHLRAKYAISQKLRPDRLAARELKVKEIQARYARLKSAERTRVSIQNKIARVLNQQKKERMQTEQQYRASYGSAPTQNDGNILHVPNMFGSAQAQQQVQTTGGNILGAQNLLLRPAQARVGNTRQKWL